MVVAGIIALGLATTGIGLFLNVVYAELMRTNTGEFDWAVPLFLGVVLALAIFPWFGWRRLPKAVAVVMSVVAAGSTAVVVFMTEPPIGRAHPSILIAMCALATAVTLRAMAVIQAVRKPTADEVADAVVSTAIACVFSAAGAAVGEVVSSATDVDFTPGGGSFGGGGASGSW